MSMAYLLACMTCIPLMQSPKQNKKWNQIKIILKKIILIKIRYITMNKKNQVCLKNGKNKEIEFPKAKNVHDQINALKNNAYEKEANQIQEEYGIKIDMLMEVHELDEFQKGINDQQFHFICHLLDEIEEKLTNKVDHY